MSKNLTVSVNNGEECILRFELSTSDLGTMLSFYLEHIDKMTGILKSMGISEDTIKKKLDNMTPSLEDLRVFLTTTLKDLHEKHIKDVENQAINDLMIKNGLTEEEARMRLKTLKTLSSLVTLLKN